MQKKSYNQDICHVIGHKCLIQCSGFPSLSEAKRLACGLRCYLLSNCKSYSNMFICLLRSATIKAESFACQMNFDLHMLEVGVNCHNFHASIAWRHVFLYLCVYIYGVYNILFECTHTGILQKVNVVFSRFIRGCCYYYF